MAEQLGDRVKHFTINEFRSFVEGGYQVVDVKVGGKTIQLGGAPGLRLSDSELKQVRHHAVLGHRLSVQAIRAQGPAGTKVGFAENIRVAVPSQRLAPEDAVHLHVFDPEVMYWAPRQMQSIWGARSIFITENGCAAADVVAEDGRSTTATG
jgi:beta-glucosidase/6-phospho-beta-glucosidase/beta-galactosidase